MGLERHPKNKLEVTSIRLEKSLKESLKELSGGQGYQTLIRDILWNYVQQKAGDYKPNFAKVDIRAIIPCICQRECICVLTGDSIPLGDQMYLCLTVHGDFVPVSVSSFPDIQD